jgi:hypothetical protein
MVSLGGAGYGNKTSESSGKGDSTMGKLMEKAGGMLHNEKMESKGLEKREQAGFNQGGSDSYQTGSSDNY